MTKNSKSSVIVRKTTLKRLKSQKVKGETYDRFLNRMLDDRELERKNYSEIEKATQMAKETLDACKKELDDLFE